MLENTWENLYLTTGEPSHSFFMKDFHFGILFEIDSRLSDSEYLRVLPLGFARERKFERPRMSALAGLLKRWPPPTPSRRSGACRAPRFLPSALRSGGSAV